MKLLDNEILELHKIQNLLVFAAELGAANYAKTIKPKSDMISQNQAYKDFGETFIKTLIDKKLLDCKRIGIGGKTSTKHYSRLEILAAKKSFECLGLVTTKKVKKQKVNK